MTAYNLKLDETPHHIVVEEDRGEKIECWGYRKSTCRTAAVYLAGFLTLGMFSLIVFYWKRDWGLRLTHRKCPLENADSVIVKDKYERMHRAGVVKQQVGVSKCNVGVFSAATIETVTRRQMNLSDNCLRFLQFQKTKYIWDSQLQTFFKMRGLDMHVPCTELYNVYSNGLDYQQTSERRELYGLNEIYVRVRPILVLLLKEVMNPFYVFQLFTVILWFSINYIYYTICVVVMSAISISISLYTTRTESTRLRKMAEVKENVLVLRPDGIDTLPSAKLVPGDVIVIPACGCQMTCDVVLLAGNCIVNESMLTGESVPVTKTPLPNPGGVEMVYSMDGHKRHTLFCGTQVIQVRTYGDELVKGVVIQTGFSTAKGQLVRSILYPKPTEIKLYRDALLFVGILAVIAFFGFLYTAVIMTLQHASVAKTIIHALDVITIAIPPALPAALTIGMVYAQFRLKKQGIYCISPQRINLCGTIDVVCFDKTGTLTEDGLDLLGVLPVTDRCFNQMSSNVSVLPAGPFTAAMATCHELIEVQHEITGDPIDLKMFEATGWSLKLVHGNEDSERFPTASAVAIKATFVDGVSGVSIDSKEDFSKIAIVKTFPFASALQTMSVITADVLTDETYAFVKGSPEKITKLSKSQSIPPDFQDVLDAYTKDGLRLLAVAWKPVDIDPRDTVELSRMQRDSIECDLDFLGLLIMQNKLKPATTSAISELNLANIRNIMVTGDNIFTAINVGRKCGMISPGSTVMRIEAEPPSVHDKPKITITPLAEDHVSDVGILDAERNPRESEKISLHQEDRRRIALDGTTFGIILKHYPLMMPKIAAQGLIFARMSPNQKSQLVESMQSLGLSVAMCGDGANDCGALKQAHVGIALSQAEASVAAPFTSTTATISCIPTVIKEGRCAMVTSFGLFKYMAMYSLVMFTSVTILTSVKFYIGDMQFFVIDILLCTSFVLTVGGNKAYHQISIKRPHTKLVTPPIVFALIAQIFLQMGFQLAALLLVKIQPWYTPPDTDSEHRNVVSYENTSVFLVANFQYLIFAFLYTPGPPYSTRFYRNILLLLVFIINLFVLMGFLFAPPPKIMTVFEMTDIPSYSFKVLLLGLVVAHLSLAASVEYLLAPSRRLMDLVTCRLCRKKPAVKYQGVELRLLKKSFMELITESTTV